MRQVQMPPSQVQLKPCVGPLPNPQAQGILAFVEHGAVSAAHGPYGRATSILVAMDAGQAESPHAKGQVAAAFGVPLGRSEKTDVGP